MSLSRTVGAALAALFSVACSPAVRSGPEAGPRDGRELFTFTGHLDAATGELRIVPTGPAAVAAAVTGIPVVQDGTPGSNPPDTVELVTVSHGLIPGGCGATDGYEAVVRLQSFFPAAALASAHVELLSMTPTGRELCNGVPAIPGTSAALGLVSYGTLSRAGLPGDAATAAWRFRHPDSTSFTFTGRVVAELLPAASDTAPPTSSVTPAAGPLPAGATLTLTCEDAGAGCAAIHYTLDGSEPTAASATYQAPIPVLAGLTLRWFAVDRLGNAEPLRAAAFTLDAAPPAVVTIDPAQGAADVSEVTVVAVAFSEPMQAGATSAAITLEGPAGAVAAVVTGDVAGQLFTLVPTAPLTRGAVYTARVATTARDLAGNALPAEQTATFTTRPPWDQLSGAGSATLDFPGVAYDAAGNGLAVWTAGYKVLYAAFTAATGSWGPATLLAEPAAPYYGGADVRVAAGTSSFAVAWLNDGTLKAAVFTNGVPGATRSFLQTSQANWNRTFDVASNGAGFAVVGLAYSTSIPYAYVLSGSTWTSYNSISTYRYAASQVALAGSGTGYRAVFSYNANAMVTTFNGSSWSSESAYGNGTSSAPVIAASSTLTCIAALGAAGAAPWVTAISGASSMTQTIGTAVGTQVAVAVVDGRCAAVAATATGPVGRVYTGSAFGASTSLATGTSPADAVAVAPVGSTGFAAAAVIRGATSELLYNPTSAWAWSAAAAQPLEGEAAVPRAVVAARTAAAGPARFGWLQPDLVADHLRVRAYDGAALGAAQIASLPPQDGTAAGPRLAATAAGDVLAVWTQEDLGTTNVFGRLRLGGTWGQPVLLASGASGPLVASNGTGFMVAYAKGTQAVARRYAAGAWEAPLVIGTGLPAAVASDGTGYAAAGRNAFAPWGSLFHSGAWTAPTALAIAGASSYQPTVAGRAGEYLFAWDNLSSSYVSTVQVLRVTGAGSSWTWLGRTTIGSTAASQGPALAAGPGGFGVTWYTSGASAATSYAYGAVLQSGVWSTQVALRTCSGTGAVAIASNGAGYVAASQCNLLSAVAWSAGAWGTVRTIDATIDEFALAASGTDYALAFRAAGAAGRITFVRLTNPAAGTITAPFAVETASEPTSTFVSLLHDGTAYLAGWTQYAVGSTTATRVFTRGGL